MLVDIIVAKGEIVAAKPIKEMVPPIILVRTESGSLLPAIKWLSNSGNGMNDRLENRVYGKLKGEALKQAFKGVRDNGGLDISGEYGSLEINPKDFVEGSLESSSVLSFLR